MPSRMLKHARFSEREGQSGLQSASEMHVGCLGGKWAAGLMQRPLAALENMFRPSPKMLKKPMVSEPEGPFDL